MKVILASKSPRRKELMDLLGIDYEIIVSNVVFPALGHDWSNKNGVCARENCAYECKYFILEKII